VQTFIKIPLCKRLEIFGPVDPADVFLGGRFSCNNSITGSWELAGDKICISGMIHFVDFHFPLL
jgi:hypothetical protein